LLLQHPLLTTGLGVLGVGEFLELRRSIRSSSERTGGFVRQ